MSREVKRENQGQTLKGIRIHLENCVRCYLCQLECSFLKKGSFNPEEAFIKVDWRWPSDEVRITFTEDCDGCGICARACIYECLSIKED